MSVAECLDTGLRGIVGSLKHALRLGNGERPLSLLLLIKGGKLLLPLKNIALLPMVDILSLSLSPSLSPSIFLPLLFFSLLIFLSHYLHSSPCVSKILLTNMMVFWNSRCHTNKSNIRQFTTKLFPLRDIKISLFTFLSARHSLIG